MVWLDRIVSTFMDPKVVGVGATEFSVVLSISVQQLTETSTSCAVSPDPISTLLVVTFNSESGTGCLTASRDLEKIDADDSLNNGYLV